MNLHEMTGPELVTQYNQLLAQTGSNAAPLNGWKKAKGLLVDMIEDLQRQSDMKDYSSFKHDTIRETSIALLCHVDHIDEKDNRSVGLLYNEIVDAVGQLFPESKTTVACLRWYAVKIRAEEKGYEGLTLPQKRPRVKK